MSNVANLKAIIDADTTGLERGAGKAKSALGSLSSGMGGAGVASGALSVALGGLAANVAVGVVGAAVEGGKAAVKMAGDLQQAVANISSIKPEINTKQVFDALNEMQTRVPQTAKELGDSLYDVFSSVNVTQKEGLALVEKFGRGAVGAQTDAKTFGTATMGVMNAYKLAVKDADHISDLFFNTIKTGVVTGPQLAAGLGPVTSAAKSAGQSIESMFAALAASTKEGGEASQNLNNINNLFQKLTTDKAKAGFTGLGIAVSDSGGKFRQINEIVGDFIKKTAGLSEVAKADLLNKIFPDAQARQGFQVLVSQFDTLNAALEENKTKAGAARAAYETMSNTFNSQSALLKNSWNAILTEIGGRLLPVLTPLVRTFAAELPGAISATKAAFAELSAATVPALEGLLSSLAGVPVKLEDVKRATQQAARDTATGFAAAWPAIQQGAAAVLKPAIDFIVGLFRQVVTWVRENMPLIQATIKQVASAINAIWRDYGEPFKKIVLGIWDIVSGGIKNTLSLILNLLKLGMQVLTGDWRGAWETVKKIFSDSQEYIKMVLSRLWSGVVAIFDSIKTALYRAFQWIFEQAVNLGRNIARGMSDGVRNGAKWVIDGVKSMANDAIGATKSVLGIRSPSVVYFGIGVHMMQGMANGIKAGAPTVYASMTATLLRMVEASKTKADLISRATRDLMVAKFGDNSAQVLKFDHPELGAAGAKSTAAELAAIAANTQKVKDAATFVAKLRQEFAALLSGERDQAALSASMKGLSDSMEPARRAWYEADKALLLFNQKTDEGRLAVELYGVAFESLGETIRQTITETVAMRKALALERGNEGRTVDNISQTVEEAVMSGVEEGARRSPWRDVMVAAWGDISPLLSQAVSGRRSGGLLGGILGGLAGFAIGGPAGALAGFNVGAAAGNAYQNGGLGSALVEGGLAYVAGRGGPGVVFNGSAAASSGGGGGRSVSIGTVNVHNPTDAARLERFIVGSGVIESRNPY